jgi:hypothetical protein
MNAYTCGKAHGNEVSGKVCEFWKLIFVWLSESKGGFPSLLILYVLHHYSCSIVLMESVKLPSLAVRLQPPVNIASLLCTCLVTWHVFQTFTLMCSLYRNINDVQFSFDDTYSKEMWNISYTENIIELLSFKYTQSLLSAPIPVAARSKAAWLLGSRIRIPLRAWMFVSCVYMLCCSM